MKDVTLRQLRFLSEAARTGSLAGAALSMHVTAPAVGQQLRLLEREVGLPLLERGRGGQEVTEAGALVLATARRIEAEIRACSDQLGALRRGESGHVALGAVSTAKYFAPRLLAAFQREHPGVRLALVVGNRAEIVDRLESFEIDLVVMGRAPSRLDVVQEVLADHPYVVVAPPDHPLVGRPRLSFDQVAREPFLLREPGSSTRAHADDLFATVGMRPTVVMEIASNETIKQAVMAGLGIAVISEHTVGAELRDGRLAVLRVAQFPVMQQWLAVRMAQRAVGPASSALWDFLVAEAGDLIPQV